jgi:hypothetical protein
MAAKNEVLALLKHQNGTTTRIELNYGSGYLSQSSRTITISSDIKKIEWYDGRGNKTRTSEF